MKKVLITGYRGFVGQHCLQYFIENTDWEFICIKSLESKETYHEKTPRVKVYKHDLSLPLGNELINKNPNIIINLASESNVEKSTLNPVYCLKNNYDIAINMCEFARNCKNLELFVQISTDEIYGESLPDFPHKEWFPIVPSNPYAASKAAQEAVAISYWKTYGVPLVIVNAMNIIGERQNSEKFIPKIIQKISLDQEVPIYACNNTIGSRVYLHADNLADALIFISKIKPKDKTNCLPDRYNVCGNKELNNLELADMIAGIMGKELKYKLMPSQSNRPGYDGKHALDGSKIRNLGWKPPFSLLESLERIVDYYTN